MSCLHFRIHEIHWILARWQRGSIALQNLYMWNSPNSFKYKKNFLNIDPKHLKINMNLKQKLETDVVYSAIWIVIEPLIEAMHIYLVLFL